MRTIGFQAGIAEWLAMLPTASGERFVKVMQRGTLSIELYAPRGVDPQTPHLQDEIYVVIAGRGQFVCADQRAPCGAGDILFVPAGVVHRFEDFSDDLVVWVVFFGPQGGERPGDAAI